MKRFIASTLLSALTSASLANMVHAQSTTSDPLGINALDDTSIQRQRGGLQEGTNSSLAMRPDSYSSEDTVSSWSFENGDIILHQKNNRK